MKGNEKDLILKKSLKNIILETKKVQDFLACINALELAAAKQQVQATPALLANFQYAANLIALSVTPIQVSTSTIAVANTEKAHKPKNTPSHVITTSMQDSQSTTSSLTQPTQPSYFR
jgi:hypothetical protein